MKLIFPIDNTFFKLRKGIINVTFVIESEKNHFMNANTYFSRTRKIIVFAKFVRQF